MNAGRRSSRTLVTSVLAALVAVTLAGCAHVAPRPLPAIGAAQWREDVAYFDQQLVNRHKNAFHHVSRDSFERSIAELQARLPALSDAEAYLALKRITAAVGDGHTGMLMPSNFHRYPLGLLPFGHDYRVVSAVPEARALLGGTLVAIGGVPLSELEARLLPYIAQDENEWFVRQAFVTWLVTVEALQQTGVVHDTLAAEITVRDSSGRLVRVTVPAVAFGTPVKGLSARAKAPLSSERHDGPLWFQALPGDTCVYVSFTGYAHLAKYSAPLWRYVDAHHITRLIVDMRRNGGGNYLTGRHQLIGPAAHRLARGPLRHIDALIGNATFSAAMINAIDWRDHCHATLIGEPIGERPNSYSERRVMTLPHSRAVVTYSVCYYKFQPSDEPPTVLPDVTVMPTWSEYAAGRDPVLERAIAGAPSR